MKLIFLALVLVVLNSASAQIDQNQLDKSADEVQIDSLKETVKTFFSQFHQKELQLQLCMEKEGKKVPLIAGFGSCFSDGSMRWLETLHRFRKGSKVLDTKEVLLNQAGDVLNAHNSHCDGKSSAVIVVRKSGWRDKANEHLFRTFWFGYFWNGSEYQLVTNTKFWKDADCSLGASKLNLIVKKDSLTDFNFKFSKLKNGQFRLESVSQRLSLPGFKVLSEYKVVRDEGRFSGWEFSMADSEKETSETLYCDVVSSASIDDESMPLAFKTFTVPNGVRVLEFGKRITKFEYEEGKVVESKDPKQVNRVEASLDDAGKAKFGVKSDAPKS